MGTPLTALAMEKLAMEAGIPQHILQMMTPDTASTPDVGNLMSTDPVVRQLSFTGSTAVGKLLTQQCSSTLKRVSMELGGNAPFIVFEDADVDRAVDAAMASKFRNAGQTCVCGDRFLIHDKVYDEFIEKLAARTAALTVGHGMEEGTDIGPLITRGMCSCRRKSPRCHYEGRCHLFSRR